jgi:L-threonylcarbamoyladenylate synthase
MAAQARIYRGTPRNLALLAKRIRAGGLVAVPTETVYGLAADATSRAACLRIFSAKGRPISDPLIVHIASLRDLERVARPNPAALRLAGKFWPGPLTIVLPKTDAVPDAATAGLKSVAVRMPSHPLFRRLIRLAGVPLAAPSANPFGYLSPTTADHVRRGLGTPVAKAARFRTKGAQLAPGQLERHYSPRTPVVLHGRMTPLPIRGEAWLFIARPLGMRPHADVFWLDPHGDLRRAARRLFSTLRRLDERGYRRIHVELPAGGGLAEAMADRLARAGAR